MISCVAEITDLIMLRQALNNPKSSMELNNWMDDKLENKMEAFSSMNRFLKDMLDKAESRISQLEESNAKAESEKIDLLLQLQNAESQLKHEKEITTYKLELEKSKYLIELAACKSEISQQHQQAAQPL